MSAAGESPAQRAPIRPLREVRRLISLALPLIAGLTVATMMGVVDTIMLGRVGAIPLAVVSLSTSALSILYAALYGFTGPVGILVGNAYGADDGKRVTDALNHGLLGSLLAGLFGGVAMLAVLPLLPHLGQPPEVLAALPPYWICMAAAMAPFTLQLTYKQAYDAIDRPWLSVLLVLSGVAVNVPLNYILIFGHLGFPPLGVFGAGLASLLSSLFGLAVIAAHWRWAPLLAPFRTQVPLSVEGFRSHLREGLPMAAQYLMEGSAFALAGLMVGWFGATALAANQIVSAVTTIIYMGPLGMSAAVSIRIAQALGRGGRERAAAIGWAAMGVVVLWMGCFALFISNFGDNIAALLVDDPAVIVAAGAIFSVFAVMQVVDGIQSTSLGALRGLMDNRWPTVVTLIAYWGAALPASYIFGVRFGFEAQGVWAGFGVGLLFAAVLLTWRFRHLTKG